MFMKLKEFGGIISHSVVSCPIMENSVSIIFDTESSLYQQKEFSPTEHVPGSSWYVFSRRTVARAMRLIAHLHLLSKLRMSGAIPSLPLYAVHRENFTFHCCLLLKCVYAVYEGSSKSFTLLYFRGKR
jgi:hypothetical protein